eukprot:TRINITY_DN3212_c0_g1_i1.p1 TRINITY_DN3212_c0_g1~~TRINITY_DN3212_c0_g1_i1.p1  ORF type:complete len:324 (+),score=86.48 TRINITY_DN3212_c0_g1_i1:77-1048(+)
MERERCVVCSKIVYPIERTTYDNQIFHKSCFKCSDCKLNLKLETTSILDGKVVCSNCFKKKFFSKGSTGVGNSPSPKAVESAASTPSTIELKDTTEEKKEISTPQEMKSEDQKDSEALLEIKRKQAAELENLRKKQEEQYEKFRLKAAAISSAIQDDTQTTNKDAAERTEAQPATSQRPPSKREAADGWSKGTYRKTKDKDFVDYATSFFRDRTPKKEITEEDLTEQSFYEIPEEEDSFFFPKAPVKAVAVYQETEVEAEEVEAADGENVFDGDEQVYNDQVYDDQVFEDQVYEGQVYEEAEEVAEPDQNYEAAAETPEEVAV